MEQKNRLKSIKKRAKTSADKNFLNKVFNNAISIGKSGF